MGGFFWALEISLQHYAWSACEGIEMYFVSRIDRNILSSKFVRNQNKHWFDRLE
jgi:hypothetical protein